LQVVDVGDRHASSATMTSSFAKPAAAAGELASIMSMRTPDSRASAKWRTMRPRHWNGLPADADPRATHAAFADQRDRDALSGRRRIAKQMPCAEGSRRY
jgi:hypothetical protein